MPRRNFKLRPLGASLAVALLWQGAPDYNLKPVAQSFELRPAAPWDGSTDSGEVSPREDVDRATAKPAMRLLDPPNQTITDEITIRVAAAASENGSLANNFGIDRIEFELEGNAVAVKDFTIEAFSRPDGSSYVLPCWAVKIKRPSGKQGEVNLRIEAFARDETMQSRVIGPFTFLMRQNEFDHHIKVAKSGGPNADFTNMSDAYNFIRTNNAQHPLIEVIEGGDYNYGAAIGRHIGIGYTTIRATEIVRFTQAAQALPGAFARASTRIGRMHFQGANIFKDFDETLQFASEDGVALHWLDGINIVQSRGRYDTWRKVPRNMVPALYQNGAYFTDCRVQDVNDWGDQARLARGNVTLGTWGDALQNALCSMGNQIFDHSSVEFYQNIDALTINYTGTGTPSISFPGSNLADNRTMRLSVDGVEVASFLVRNDLQGAAFRANTNYTVANVVNWINSVPNFSATLLDDTRAGASISLPNTTSGAGWSNFAFSGSITLVTHFDVHSDIWQLSKVSIANENVIFSFNQGRGIDAQLSFTEAEQGLRDWMFYANAFYNRLGVPDQALQSQFDDGPHSHCFAGGNTFASQAFTFRTGLNFSGDSYTQFRGNVARDFSDAGGGAPSNIVVSGNHIWAGETPLPGSNNTTIGGDASTLFVDAENGDFRPAGALLTNLAARVLPVDIACHPFAASDVKGAVAIGSSFVAPAYPTPVTPPLPAPTPTPTPTPAPPPPPSDPVTTFLALIASSPDSGFFDFRDADPAFTATDENGGNPFTRTDGFKPARDATLGAIFTGGNKFIQRTQGNGDYTTTLSLIKGAASGDASSASVMHDNSAVIESGGVTIISEPTKVDGVSVANRGEFHTATDDGQRHTVEVTGDSVTSARIRIGRSSVGFDGSIRAAAIIKEADFPTNLAQVRAAAVAAVEAS